MSRSGEALRRSRVLLTAARLVVVGALVIGLTVAFAGGAAASRTPLRHRNGPGGRPAAAGTVTSAPADNAFSITTRSGVSLNVEVSATTTYVERGVSSPSLDDVTQNVLVAVFGSVDGATVSATEVNIWAPKNASGSGNGRPAAAGVVTSSPSDNSFSISTRSGGTLTVDVSATTTYAERGVASPMLANVSQGELVAVFGAESDGTVTATEVVISQPRPHGGYVTAGTVQAAPSSTGFSITAFNGTTVAVDITTSTTYIERGVASPTLGDVSQGEFVGVFGAESDGTVTANEVVICQPRANRDYATAGTVQAAPTSAGFTVTTFNGTSVSVAVTATTTYAEYGVSSPTIDNVIQGEFVGVFGVTANGSVTATEVVIAGSQRQGLFGFGHRFHFSHRFGGFGFGRGQGGPVSRPFRSGATGASGQATGASGTTGTSRRGPGGGGPF